MPKCDLTLIPRLCYLDPMSLQPTIKDSVFIVLFTQNQRIKNLKLSANDVSRKNIFCKFLGALTIDPTLKLSFLLEKGHFIN